MQPWFYPAQCQCPTLGVPNLGGGVLFLGGGISPLDSQCLICEIKCWFSAITVSETRSFPFLSDRKPVLTNAGVLEGALRGTLPGPESTAAVSLFPANHKRQKLSVGGQEKLVFKASLTTSSGLDLVGMSVPKFVQIHKHFHVQNGEKISAD